MRVIAADTHVHLYECYDLATAFERLRAGLLQPDAEAVACLAERADCEFFERLKDGRLKVEGVEPDPGATSEDESLLVRVQGKPLYLLAGRQIVSRERIEILALGVCMAAPEDGPAEEIVRLVSQYGGVPVLSWAAGKWFGARGDTVLRLLEAFSPSTLLIGDTSMRPLGWGTPRLMRLAQRRGFRVVMGSDPLPSAGEEHGMAAYATLIGAEMDRRRPAASVRRALVSGEVSIVAKGRRETPAGFLRRFTRHMSAARRPARRA